MPEKNTDSISRQIMTALLVIALIPLVLSWYIHHRAMLKQVRARAAYSLSGSAEALATYVNTWTEMNRRMLMQNARTPAMKTMSPEIQTPVLKTIVEQYNWNYLAFTTDPEGMNISRSDDNPPRDYRDRQYIRQVAEGKTLGEQILIGKTSGLPSLVLAVPIRSAPDRLTGILAIAMTIGDISKKIAGTKIGKTGYAFLLDGEGSVIAHPAPEYARVRKGFPDHPALKAEDSRLFFFHADGREMAAASRKTDQGWTVTVCQEKEEAFQAVSNASLNSAIIFILTVSAIPMAAYPFSKRLSEPIQRLTDAARAYSRGNSEKPIAETSRTDEIGRLARAVERLGTGHRHQADSPEKD